MDHLHTDIAYAFVAREAPAGQPKDEESSDLRWLTAGQLRALDVSEVGQNSREIALYALENILGSWESVSFDELEA